MSASPRVRGLYAITPEGLATADLLARCAAALTGGARMLQYRDKSRDARRRRTQADALAALCRRHGAAFIVNDDLELALACDADGVHLGREDGELAEARARLGPARLLGASCYDSLELAERAVAAGADHIAFGAVFVSATKPGAVRAPLTLFGAARERLPGVARVAIGGIAADNAARVIEAGADALAVVNAVFGAADPQAAARRIARLFDTPPTAPAPDTRPTPTH